MYFERRAGNYIPIDTPPSSDSDATPSTTDADSYATVFMTATVPYTSTPAATTTGPASSAANTAVTSAPAPSSAAPSSNAKPTSYTISVGAAANPHQYQPSSLNNVNVGDTVVFEFYPTNHSVVRAAYGTPCIPYETTVKGGRGFYSNPFLVSDQFAKPQWSFTVDTAEPIFFYCTAIDSCLKNGMVGAINPNASQTFDSQQQKALNAKVMLVPGQDFPAEGSGVPTASNSAASSNSDNHHLSNGTIAGIAVAAAVVAILAGALFFVLGRNKVYKKWVASERGDTNARTSAWLAGAKPGPWSSDVGSSRAAEDQSHGQYTSGVPGHQSMMVSPSMMGSDSNWNGGSPLPGAQQSHYYSMYGAPTGAPHFGGGGAGGYAPMQQQQHGLVSEIGGGEVKGGATSGAMELSAEAPGRN